MNQMTSPVSFYIGILEKFFNIQKQQITNLLFVSIIKFGMVTITGPYFLGVLNRKTVSNEINSQILTFIPFQFIVLLLMSIQAKLEKQLESEFDLFVKHYLFEQYMTVHENSYSESDSASHMNAILTVSATSAKLTSFIIQKLLPDTCMIVGVTLFMIYKKQTKIMTLFGLNVCLIYHLTQSKINLIVKEYESKQKQSDIISSKIDDIFSNLMNVFLAGLTQETLKTFNDLCSDEIHMSHIANKTVQELNLKVQFTTYICCLILPFYVVITDLKRQSINGQDSIFLILASYYFTTAVDRLFESFVELGRDIFKSVRYLHLFIQSDPYLDNFSNQKPNSYDIAINELSFTYPKSSKPILANLSMVIKEGECVALLGQTGSGKSTLAKIILGFCRPTTGSVRIGGIDVTKISKKELRNNVFYINQRTLLFNDTVLNNILYGNGMRREDVESLLKTYNLDVLFSRESVTLDTMVYMKGNLIPAGIQKVIIILRGVFRLSRILIIDEPFSSVDGDTRLNIMRLITGLNKTVLIITHDIPSGLECRTINMNGLQLK